MTACWLARSWAGTRRSCSRGALPFRGDGPADPAPHRHRRAPCPPGRGEQDRRRDGGVDSAQRRRAGSLATTRRSPDRRRTRRGDPVAAHHLRRRSRRCPRSFRRPRRPRCGRRRRAPEQTWIEVDVRFEDGTPFDGNVVIELPGGRKTEGAPDANGIIRIDGIDPGSCKLTITELDASAWQ